MIFGAVEGLVDEAVLTRLIEHVHLRAGPVYGKRGKPRLRQRLAGYNQAARHGVWVVLVDLDQEFRCAPELVAQWLASPGSNLHLRVAVRESEAWLLADGDRIADFLRVARSRVPTDPESQSDPKATMVNLARRSRRREIREEMVPRPASGRAVGPAYTARLIQFVLDRKCGWQPDVAARRSDSLHRCLMRLREIAAQSP